MKTELIKVKGDWQEVVDDARVTAGKSELGHEPSDEFKIGILIAEHSPIRNISFKWQWRDIKSWVATHWVRHKWECYVKSQRSDRTGVPRDELPQSAPVDFVGEANVQHLIDTMRKRLCHKAAKETREYAYDLKKRIEEADQEIANVLVPNCVYRCGCPEIKKCGKMDKFLLWCYEKYGVDARQTSIEDRYEFWNEFFNEGGW